MVIMLEYAMAYCDSENKNGKKPPSSAEIIDNFSFYFFFYFFKNFVHTQLDFD